MQASTQPQAVTAPAQNPKVPVSVTTVGPDGKPQTLTIPTTREEVDQLLMQRQELAEQLANVSGRRQSLSEQVRSAPEGASRTGLEDRIRVLDQRIIQLETDLAAAGKQLSSARAELVSSAQIENRSGGGDDFEEGMAAGVFSTLFFAVPVVLYFARRRWKRPRGAVPTKGSAESDGRLERMERGMEAIAIEVERVSEGQRFVTKLLSEQPPLGQSHRIAQPAMVEHETPAKR
ncbi:MAG: hypothetical protein ABI681_01055 [Gemmatimonadales bacterium]